MQVGNKRRETAPAEAGLTAQAPVDVAGDPLVGEFERANGRERRQMDVGEVREGDHQRAYCQGLSGIKMAKSIILPTLSYAGFGRVTARSLPWTVSAGIGAVWAFIST